MSLMNHLLLNLCSSFWNPEVLWKPTYTSTHGYKKGGAGWGTQCELDRRRGGLHTHTHTPSSPRIGQSLPPRLHSGFINVLTGVISPVHFIKEKTWSHVSVNCDGLRWKSQRYSRNNDITHIHMENSSCLNKALRRPCDPAVLSAVHLTQVSVILPRWGTEPKALRGKKEKDAMRETCPALVPQHCSCRSWWED